MRLRSNLTDDRRHVLLRCMCVFLLACGVLSSKISLAQNQPTADTGDNKDRVCRVDFAGMRAVEVARLTSIVRTVAGNKYDPSQVAEDIRSLWKLGLFSNVSLKEGQQPGCGRVVVFVLEEQPLIDQVFVEGNKSFKLEDLPESLKTLKPGQLFHEGEVATVANALRDFYHEKGFPFAKISVTKQPSKEGRAKVVFGVEEGARPTVMEVHFRGNQAVSADVLAKQLLLRPRSARSMAKYVVSCLLAPLRMTEEEGILSKECSSIFNLFDRDDPLRPGQYGDKLLEYAKDQIRTYYQDIGFLAVKVSLPELTLSADQRILTVTFPILEGPRFRRGRKSIVVKTSDGRPSPMSPGEERKLLEQIRKDQIQSKNGGAKYVPVSEVQKDASALQQWAAARGYPSPRLDIPGLGKADTTWDPNTPFDLVYELVLGPQVYIRQIHVSLNGGTTGANVIWRALNVQEGERFDQRRIDESKTRLLKLGFFSKVDIRTRPVTGTQEWVDLVVDAVERPTGTIQAGAGYSTFEGPMLNAQIIQDNALGYGGRLAFSMQISSIRQFLNADYFDPHLFDSSWQGGVSGYRTQQVQSYFATTNVGARLTAGYELVHGLSLRASYRLEHINVTPIGGAVASFYGAPSIDLSNRPDLNLYQSGLLSAFRLELLYQRVDDLAALNTGTQAGTSGMFHNLFVEIADRYLGSQIRYLRTEGTLRFYIPIWKKHIQLRLMAGSGLVWSRESEGVPVFARYYPGGMNDARGYNIFSLGPRIPVLQGYGPSGYQQVEFFPIGGNLMIKGTAEVEFSVFPDLGLRGAVFVDVGNAYNLEKQHCGAGGISAPGLPEVFDPCALPSFSNLRYSAGVGLRWASPIGLLRFEWAFPLNRVIQIGGRPGEMERTFWFAMGTNF